MVSDLLSARLAHLHLDELRREAAARALCRARGEATRARRPRLQVWGARRRKEAASPRQRGPGGTAPGRRLHRA